MSRHPSVRRLRIVAVGLTIALVASSCTDKHHQSSATTTTTNGSTGSTSTTSTTPSTIRWETTMVPPAPPAPLQLPDDIAGQIHGVTEALTDADPMTRAAGLLAAYRAAGLPVIGPDGTSLTTTDTVGIPWAEVYVDAVVPLASARIPLSMVGVTLATATGGGTPERDTVNAAFLDGLRAALAGDPTGDGVAWVARLVAHEAELFDGTELTDAATTADDVYVSAPTWSLLATAGLLTALVADPATASPGHGLRTTGAAAIDVPKGCSGGERNQWIAYIISKLSTGVGLNGVGHWKGLIPHHLHVTGEVAGAVLALITAAVAVFVASGDANLEEGDNLVRTHHTSNGEHNTISLEVGFRYDPAKIGPINCLLLLLSAIGNDSLVPEPGPIPEASVDFKPGVGFVQDRIYGQIVLFDPQSVGASTFTNLTTNEEGIVRMGVLGKAQDHEIDQDAGRQEKVFSVFASTSLEGVSATSLSKMGLDSLFCAGGLIADCTRVVANLIRQMHWSLGEFTLPFVDWCGVGSQGFPPHVDPCLPEEVEGTILLHTEGASAHVIDDPSPHTVVDGRFTTDYTFHVRLESVMGPMVKPGVAVRFGPRNRNTFTVKETSEHYGSAGTTTCTGSAEGTLVTPESKVVGSVEAGELLRLPGLGAAVEGHQMDVSCTGPDGGLRIYDLDAPTPDLDNCVGAPTFHRGAPPFGQIQRQGAAMQITFDCTLAHTEDPWQHSYLQGTLQKTDD
jgi:hypothetical protein